MWNLLLITYAKIYKASVDWPAFAKFLTILEKILTKNGYRFLRHTLNTQPLSYPIVSFTLLSVHNNYVYF